MNVAAGAASMVVALKTGSGPWTLFTYVGSVPLFAAHAIWSSRRRKRLERSVTAGAH
jgi:hypothetical protein